MKIVDNEKGYSDLMKDSNFYRIPVDDAKREKCYDGILTVDSRILGAYLTKNGWEAVVPSADYLRYLEDAATRRTELKQNEQCKIKQHFTEIDSGGLK